VLVLFIVDSLEEGRPLQSLSRVETLSLEPLSFVAIRDLLYQEVGLVGALTLTIANLSKGSPGVAIERTQTLARLGRLQSTPDGFSTDLTDLTSLPSGNAVPTPPPVLQDCTDNEYRSLRLATVLGLEMSMADWSELLSEADLQIPQARVYRLLRHQLIKRDEHTLSWTDHAVFGELERRELGASDLQAVDRFFSSRTNKVHWDHLFGLHCLATGRVARGRSALLNLPQSTSMRAMARSAQTISILQTRMQGCTPTEQILYDFIKMRVTLNLISTPEAIPLAKAMIQQLGTPSSPSPRFQEVESRIRVSAWELAALILAFEGHSDESDRAVSGLEDSVFTLRTRALNAHQRGNSMQAKALFAQAFRKATDRPNKARIANGIGSLLGQKGEFEEALEWFEVSIEWMEPEHRYSPLQNLALTLLLLGRFEEALPHAQEAIALAEAHRNASLPASATCMAIVYLYLDEHELEVMGDLTLFLARRLKGEPTVPLYEGLLREAKPQRPYSQTWVKAMLHLWHPSLQPTPEPSHGASEDLDSSLDSQATVAIDAGSSTLAHWTQD